jgi:hypothetical protein
MGLCGIYPLRIIFPDTTSLFVIAREDEIDGLAFEKGQEKRLGNRIGTVVLLQHLNGLACRIAQNDGVGFEVHSDVRHFDTVYSGIQCEGQLLANHRKVLVVNGQRRLRSAVGGKRESAKSEQA